MDHAIPLFEVGNTVITATPAGLIVLLFFCLSWSTTTVTRRVGK